jgi:flagellar hook-basal body complex protein FliE
VPGPILPISGAGLQDPIRPAGSVSGGAFQDVFTSAIERVEAFGNDANLAVGKFLSGEGEDVHTVALASTRAELSFDMFMQARNKVVGAYQEIMKMQM